MSGLSLNIHKAHINRPVFFSATTILSLLIFFTVLFPAESTHFFDRTKLHLVNSLSWFYILVVAVIFITVIYLGCSRYGDIKLGPDHIEPDFSFLAWLAMLFSAGMGIGLMFFGVAEPIMHFTDPPVGQPDTIEAAREAMKLTFFHWGLHAWSIYAIVALILAFFAYRHKLPLTLRSALYPLIGDKIYGWQGNAIDVFAIIGTVLGVATSLGLGVMQINAGLNYLFGITISITVQIYLIIVITMIATISVISGLDKGVRLLSQFNLLLALLLMSLILILGNTSQLIGLFLQNTGSYLAEIISKTFNLYAYNSNNWIGGWTVFYWAFWLSWSPFVGMFIARISKGRSIREFVIGVLLVPSLLTFMWMTIFGNSAIDTVIHQSSNELKTIVDEDTALSLFYFLATFPFSYFLSCIAIFMVVIFFITSADSSAIVLDILSSDRQGPSPLWQRIYWSILIGVVALTLMLAGGLEAIQSAMIASALPFGLILMIAVCGFLKALSIDQAKKDSLEQTNLSPAPSAAYSAISWRKRLSRLVQFPSKKDVIVFNKQVVFPALRAVALELNQRGVDCKAEIDKKSEGAVLKVYHGEETDFKYHVVPQAHLQPSFMVEDYEDEAHRYFRAEVFLLEGGQDYDIMGWNQDQVTLDVVSQYEKHMHFLHTLRE